MSVLCFSFALYGKGMLDVFCDRRRIFEQLYSVGYNGPNIATLFKHDKVARSMNSRTFGCTRTLLWGRIL